MIIRKPDIEEQKQINNLAIQVHDLHVAWRPDLFLKEENLITEERLQSIIDNNEMKVAVIDGKIVGYIMFRIASKDTIGMRRRQLLAVEQLVIDQNFRHQGIGTKLLENLKEDAKRLGCTDMAISVNEENIEARNCYEKFGFKLKNISLSMEVD